MNSKCKVLVVDDIHENIELVADMLNSKSPVEYDLNKVVEINNLYKEKLITPLIEYPKLLLITDSTTDEDILEFVLNHKSSNVQ
jgi:CheY-like chemotaxis protein